MILRPDGDGWLCITQPNHAALAATLMAAWRADGFPDRPTRAQVLHATAQHDIGWALEDVAPRFNPATGAPYEFMNAPLAVRQGIWPRGVGLLADDDPYVAALVAQHALTVYRRHQREPEWREFFPLIEGLRDDLIAGILALEPAREGARATGAPGGGVGLEPRHLQSFLLDYTIVGLGDLFSLVFCSGWTEPYLMEGYRAILRGDRLTIAPDPFDGAAVALSISGRRLDSRSYRSDAELQQAWAAAPVVTLTGLAVGAPADPHS